MNEFMIPLEEILVEENSHSMSPISRALSADLLPTSTESTQSFYQESTVNRLTFSSSEVSNFRSLIDPRASPLQESSIIGSTADPQATPDLESHLKDLTFGNVKLFEPWFPAITPENPRAKTRHGWMSNRKAVLWTCFITAFTVFVTNLVLTVTAWKKYKITLDGVATLYEGDCKTVKWANSAIHILINVLATLLLGASNLTIQLLAAPTRREVDKAHAKGSWFDIGVSSFRNLWHLPPSSILLSLLLGATSIPIHLLYNSIVFSSLSTNEIAWVLATDSFLTGPNWDANTTTTNSSQYLSSIGPDYGAVSTIHNEYRNNSTSYKNHSTHDCLNAYYNAFSWRPNKLIMVTSDTREQNHDRIIPSTNPEHHDINSSVLFDWGIINQWADSGPHFMNDACSSNLNNTERSFCHGFNIDYCLYKESDTGKSTVNACHLQCSPHILLVSLLNRDSTLCILGDAIASFLETPDQSTKYLGLVSRKNIVQSGKDWNKGRGSRILWRPMPMQWRHAASIRRWFWIGFAAVVFLATGLGNISSGLINQKKYNRSIGFKALWAMGFGTANLDEIANYNQETDGKKGLFANILMANSAQAYISWSYLAFNSVLSCMLVAREWTRFGKDRKPLRVSSPVGMQRSNYVLSVPFRFGLPTMAFFCLEHWIVSESLFIVRVMKVDWEGAPTTGWTTLGYSFIPGFISITLYFLIQSSLVLLGSLRKYPSEAAMPLVSTCSAAISAACHRPEADKDAHLLPVEWGVVGKSEDGTEFCSFTTSRNVEAPTPGSEYLGMPSAVFDCQKSWRPQYFLNRRKSRNVEV